MPHSEVKDAGIPVIDISTPSPDVAQQVLHAASTFGFLFIKNDGVTMPPEDIGNMFELVRPHGTNLEPTCTNVSKSRQFFKSPHEQKSEYAIHSPKAGGKNRGWVSLQGESLDPEGQKACLSSKSHIHSNLI